MKKGVTLAEVLITLGVIGVVAAMTMPILINKYKEIVEVSELKKAYSIMSQAMQFAVPDGNWDAIPFSDTSIAGVKSWFDETIQPHIKLTKVCYDTEGCWNSGTTLLNGSKMPYDRENIGIGSHIIVFRIANGYLGNIDVWGSAGQMKNIFGVESQYPGISLYIDINGEKGPNIIGKDVFVFAYTKEKGLVPAGRDKTDIQVKQNCSKSGGNYSGVFCLEHIIRNGWKIDKENLL